MSTPYIGAHVSAAGGIHTAYERAEAIGCNAVQIFSASPRVWKRSPMPKEEIAFAHSEAKRCGIEKTVIHAIYLVNLASDLPESREKSRSVIEYDLQVDSALGGCGVVVHVGSHQGRGFDAMRDTIATEIQTILRKTPENSTFLIENSAGQQGKIASDLAEIRWLMDAVKSSRLGWCLDTCHAYCAGYTLENEKGEKSLFGAIEKYDLWDSMKVVHVNDSRDPFDSGRDRHENIGDGSIGNERFASFLSNEHIRKLPLILEVPGMDHKSGPDAENVERLKKLYGNSI